MINLKNLAIITARSGSKGLKDKNIKLLNGKPLLAYSIDAAKNSRMFEEILVSTDSEKYAEIAKQYGASVPFLRSEEMSGDTVSSWAVVMDVINNYKKIEREFETIALLQPTSPLRNAEDIIRGYQRLVNNDANAVVSVCEVDYSPLWCNILPDDFSMNKFMREEVKTIPRQNLPTYYRVNGALYILKTDILENIVSLYNNKCYAYIMPKERSIDIDDQFDFEIAELYMKSDIYNL